MWLTHPAPWPVCRRDSGPLGHGGAAGWDSRGTRCDHTAEDEGLYPLVGRTHPRRHHTPAPAKERTAWWTLFFLYKVKTQLRWTWIWRRGIIWIRDASLSPSQMMWEQMQIYSEMQAMQWLKTRAHVTGLHEHRAAAIYCGFCQLA